MARRDGGTRLDGGLARLGGSTRVDGSTRLDGTRRFWDRGMARGWMGGCHSAMVTRLETSLVTSLMVSVEGESAAGGIAGFIGYNQRTLVSSMVTSVMG